MTSDQLRTKINNLKLKRSKLDIQKAMVSFELREAERELNKLENKEQLFTMTCQDCGCKTKYVYYSKDLSFKFVCKKCRENE